MIAAANREADPVFTGSDCVLEFVPGLENGLPVLDLRLGLIQLAAGLDNLVLAIELCVVGALVRRFPARLGDGGGHRRLHIGLWNHYGLAHDLTRHTAPRRCCETRAEPRRELSNPQVASPDQNLSAQPFTPALRIRRPNKYLSAAILALFD
jgi:hypothetical protein